MDGREIPANGADLPEKILLRLYHGAKGETELIEDNGLLPADPGYRRCVTRIRMKRDTGLTVEILPPEGDASLLPAGRRYTLELNGFANALPDVCDTPAEVVWEKKRRALTLSPKGRTCTLRWTRFPEIPGTDRPDRIQEMLQAARISYDLKTAVMRAVRQNAADPAGFLAQLHMLRVPQTLYGAILELFSAC